MFVSRPTALKKPFEFINNITFRDDRDGKVKKRVTIGL